MADETFAHLTPHSHYTFAPEEDPEMRVTGKEDKAGVTVMVTLTAAGKMLPMQVVLPMQALPRAHCCKR